MSLTNTRGISVGDTFDVTRDGRVSRMTVYRVDAPGTAGTSYGAGPHIGLWVRPGGYGMTVDGSHLADGRVTLTPAEDDPEPAELAPEPESGPAAELAETADAEPIRIPFVADLSGLTRALASGHRNRRGHALTGYYPGSADGVIVAPLVRTCCAVPAELAEETGPAPDGPLTADPAPADTEGPAEAAEAVSGPRTVPVTRFPAVAIDGRTVWACCLSADGEPCGHRRNPDGSADPVAELAAELAADTADTADGSGDNLTATGQGVQTVRSTQGRGGGQTGLSSVASGADAAGQAHAGAGRGADDAEDAGGTREFGTGSFVPGHSCPVIRAGSFVPGDSDPVIRAGAFVTTCALCGVAIFRMADRWAEPDGMRHCGAADNGRHIPKLAHPSERGFTAGFIGEAADGAPTYWASEAVARAHGARSVFPAWVPDGADVVRDVPFVPGVVGVAMVSPSGRRCVAEDEAAAVEFEGLGFVRAE